MLDESTVELAALEWFRLRPVRQAQGPRQGFRRRRAYGGQDGGQVGAPYFAHSTGSGLRRARLGYAVGHGATFAKLWRAKPHLHQSRTLATQRDTLLPKLLSEELSLPAAMLAAQAGVATTSTTVLASP